MLFFLFFSWFYHYSSTINSTFEFRILQNLNRNIKQMTWTLEPRIFLKYVVACFKNKQKMKIDFVIVFDILPLHMNEERMSIAHCLKPKFSHSEVYASHTISLKPIMKRKLPRVRIFHLIWFGNVLIWHVSNVYILTNLPKTISQWDILKWWILIKEDLSWFLI